MRRWSPSAAALGALALLAVLSASAPALPKTLAEVMRETVSANPEVLRDRALVRAADHRVDERFAGFLPKLDLDADTGWEYSNSPTTRTRAEKLPGDPSDLKLWRTEGQVTLRQLIFDGFETSSREVAAEAERTAAERRLSATSERIALRVSEVYLGVMSTAELLRLAVDNEAYHREIVGKVRDRVEQGLTDQIELNLAESRLAQAMSRLTQRRGEQRAAEARYLELVGALPKDLELPQSSSAFAPTDVDLAIDDALHVNPRVLAAAAVLDARRADIDAARAKMYPRLNFEVNGATGRNLDGEIGRDSHVNVMLRLRYDLFNGMLDVATISRRTFEASAAAQADGEARRRVREETRVTYRLLYAAVARVSPLRDTVDAAMRTVDGYRAQYDLGKRTLLDLLDSRSEYFEAQSELVLADYAVLGAHYRLFFSMGRLREVLEK